MLTFTVTGQKIHRTDNDVIVAGSWGLYRCVFTFDDAWDGYDRVAVFRRFGVKEKIELSADSCIIPWEVIAEVGRLCVGVYGVKGNARMPTLWSEEIPIGDGARRRLH